MFTQTIKRGHSLHDVIFADCLSAKTANDVALVGYTRKPAVNSPVTPGERAGLCKVTGMICTGNIPEVDGLGAVAVPV